MVTGSVNSSVDMPSIPGAEGLQNQPWMEEISGFLAFDPAGVLYCLIQAFEYSYYHNIVVMASIPYLAVLFAEGVAKVASAMIQISFANKKKIAQDDEELEALNEEEGQAIYDLTEAISGMRSEVLIFLHPNITDVMFAIIDCQIILGYDKKWLTSDYRFQCYGILCSCFV